MHTIPLLGELVFILIVSMITVPLLHHIKMPSILGFLAAGLIVGPTGLGLVTDIHAIELMAEIGVVILLFTIGVEVSIGELARMWRMVVGGVIQVVVTAAGGALLAMALGVPPKLAVFLGLILAPSSTAMVLRMLGDSGQLGTPWGRLSLSVLLVQDVAVVAMMLLVPMLAADGFSMMALARQMGLATLLIAGIFILARVVLPRLFERAVALRSREVFMLVTLVAVFGTAHLAGMAGISLALGAFIAGLVVSESVFAHQVVSEVIPFRDAFNGLFFVSVGMLVNPQTIATSPLLFIGLVVGMILYKGLLVIAIGKGLKLSWRSALMAGVALCQVGEFAFVLAQQGAKLGLLEPAQQSLFLAASVATMALTPGMLALASRYEKPGLNEQDGDAPTTDAHTLPSRDHVIIVGFGINGRNVARALKQLDVEYVVVEMNVGTVRAERDLGTHIVYGDATNSNTLEHLHLARARALVVAIGEPAATRDIVATARQASAELLIIARTRMLAELEPLRALGADHVVPEEYETSIELAARVMESYGAPPHAIEREKRLLRQDRYQALRGEGAPQEALPNIVELLGALDMDYARVTEGDFAINSTLQQLNLRALSGASIIAVVRDEQPITNPPGDFSLRAEDLVVLVGSGDQTQAARHVLASGRAPDPEASPRTSGLHRPAQA